MAQQIEQGKANHAGHDHSVNESNEKRVLIALVITGLFMLCEAVGGIIAGSLVLLADAGHMLVDFLALALAWLGFRIARRPPDKKRSFGYHRFPVLAAFTNGLALFFITAMILYEAVNRLIDPPEQIMGGVLLGVAIAGLIANIICYLILTLGRSHNINVKSAALHVLADLLGSVAAIVAALVIMSTGWKPIDPILSVVVCLLILRSAWKIVRHAGHILMQGTPPDFDVDKLRAELLESIPNLADVHQIHVWELTEGKPVISLHAQIANGADTALVLPQIKEVLRQKFDLDHSVVQLESNKQHCPD